MKEELQQRQPNCIGFVYSQLGFIPEERFVEPKIGDLLKKFDLVHSVTQAKALGIIVFLSDGPILAHMAIVNDDKSHVTHRSGEGEEIQTVSIYECLRDYDNDLVTPQVLFLVPKK